MGLDNVAVQWPRTGQFYDPVAPADFVDFGEIVDVPGISAPTAALAELIAKTGTVRATAYTEVVDLILGLDGVLYATDAAAEDEDPVIDPDGCAWIAGGIERFVITHRPHGEAVTFESVGTVLRSLLADGRLAEQQLRWLDSRLDALLDESGAPPQWTFTCAELSVVAAFYRRCAERGFAVYAESAAPRRAAQS
ncbi:MULTISPECIES: hypothetical protein [unclassified Micromonospora]|uniref:hypothetical protein n=1 Tax=unclassified Micromonospora TaxID=2617518 RepID=UPI001033B8A2|nr:MULTISPECIES: hypothetical protein [unclassified Micromonospora]QKW16927.1 hypothetical protein HUT12_32140 [Verrucosispora sp. NA02020]TBL35580.1 hypothetical protein EYA84_13700 [Verrucosispora sp. SN26_14.1]